MQFSVSNSLFMTLMERALHRNSTPPKSLQPLYSILHSLECKPMYTLILSDSCESSVHVITSCLVQRPIQLGWCLVLAVKTGKCDCRFTCQFHLCFWCIFFDIVIFQWRLMSAVVYSQRKHTLSQVTRLARSHMLSLILVIFWNQKKSELVLGLEG